MNTLKFILAFVLGFVVAYVYEIVVVMLGRQVFNMDNPGLIIYGYRLHHSLYGQISLVLWATKRKEFYLGFGLGIIAQHTMYDNFRFISREV